MDNCVPAEPHVAPVIKRAPPQNLPPTFHPFYIYCIQSYRTPFHISFPALADLALALVTTAAGLPLLTENLLRGFTPIHEERQFDDRNSHQLLSRSDNDYDSNTPQVSTLFFALYHKLLHNQPPIQCIRCSTGKTSHSIVCPFVRREGAVLFLAQ